VKRGTLNKLWFVYFVGCLLLAVIGFAGVSLGLAIIFGWGLGFPIVILLIGDRSWR
jgi:hypothetical protein